MSQKKIDPDSEDEQFDEWPEELDPLDPDEDPAVPPRRSGEPGRAGGVAETLRKAMAAGLGAVFMTEEGVRAMVKDLKLPKDVVGFVVGQAERSKVELMRMLGAEMRRFFESAALREELVRLLSQMTIELKAEIRVRPGGGATQVKVRTSRVRRRKGRS